MTYSGKILVGGRNWILVLQRHAAWALWLRLQMCGIELLPIYLETTVWMLAYYRSGWVLNLRIKSSSYRNKSETGGGEPSEQTITLKVTGKRIFDIQVQKKQIWSMALMTLTTYKNIKKIEFMTFLIENQLKKQLARLCYRTNCDI
jgi:hypothetical protein